MKKITFTFVAFCFVFSANITAQIVDAETTSSDIDLSSRQVGTPLSAEYPQSEGALIYDNGPHFNVPGNPNISLLQNTTLGQTTLGAAANGAFTIADDFTLTSTYEITAVDFYGYQTGAPTAPVSISGVVVQIWDGDPSVGGSVIYGDLFTNVLVGATWSNTYRQSETTPGTDRAIYLLTAELTGLTLDPGTYWIDWQFIGDGAFSGPWQPPVCELDTVVPGDAFQSNGGVYAPWLDGGSLDPLDAPFQLYGTEVLGVNDVAIGKAVNIYPSPAQNEVTISNNSQINLEKATVYNIQGKLMQTVDLSNMGTETTLNVSSFPSGVYLINIQGQNGSVTKRFIKQ